MPAKPSPTPTRKQLMFYKVHLPEDFLRGYSVEVGEDGETQRVSHGSSLDFDFGQDAKNWHLRPPSCSSMPRRASRVDARRPHRLRVPAPRCPSSRSCVPSSRSPSTSFLAKINRSR